MKKKNVIIPAVCVCLSLAAVVIMTVFTTPVSYAFARAKNTDSNLWQTNNIEVFKESYKNMETVCKLAPNTTNLCYTSMLFSPDYIGNAEYKSVCSDYDEKSVYYAEKLLTAIKNPKKSFSYNYFMTSIIASDRNSVVAYSYANYIKSLFNSGKKTEAKKVTEEYIHSLTADNIEGAWMMFHYYFEAFDSVRLSDDKADLEWFVGIENYVVDFHNSNIDKLAKRNDYYSSEFLSEWTLGKGYYLTTELEAQINNND